MFGSSGSIIKGLGFSTIKAAVLDCADRSLQVISLLIAGLVATRWANTRLLMMTVGNVICVFGTALMAFLPFTHQMIWPRLIGFWLDKRVSVMVLRSSGYPLLTPLQLSIYRFHRRPGHGL